MTLRNLIADVLAAWFEADPDVVEAGLVHEVADAILADPTLAAIIDLAAHREPRALNENVSPEVRALLADWRAER